MEGPESLRPRLITGAHDALRAVETVHPDVWSEPEHQEELLRAGELLEAATMLLAASHFQMVAPDDDSRSAELRALADRLVNGRTIVGEPDEDEAASDGADVRGVLAQSRQGR